MIAYALIAAAGIALLWPSTKKPKVDFDLGKLEGEKVIPAAPKQITYIQAVAALQTVQKRLDATEELDEDQCEAINVITLALVRGSSSEN
jgi:hypothetical protein